MDEKRLEEKWRQATFTDNVIFTWIVSENKDICLKIIQLALPELEIKKILEIRSEFTQKDSLKAHGVRFDVYAEDEKGQMYDIEMQVTNHHDLGKRISYYQSNLVRRSLLANQSYQEKRNTYVIFICDFDFVGLGLPRYTTTLRLEEDLSKMIDTGEHNVILNARAKHFDNGSHELKALLEYIKDNQATDNFTKQIEQSIVNLKQNTERKLNYMDYEQHILTEKYFAKQERNQEILTNMIKKLDKKGYSESETIKTIEELTDFKADDIKNAYNKVLVK